MRRGGLLYLVGGVFLLVGLPFLLMGLTGTLVVQEANGQTDRIGELIFTFAFGGGFTLIGALAIYFPLQKRLRKQRLMAGAGQRVMAKIKKVDLNLAHTFNGEHPWEIAAEWHDPRTNTVYRFESEDLWFDPREYITRDEIEVLIDPDKPKIYHVDVSFLPKFEG